MPFLASGTAFLIFGTIWGPSRPVKKSTKVIESNLDKPYRLAVFRNRKGDLTKEWYVEFICFL
jgi:hypothetical protein